MSKILLIDDDEKLGGLLSEYFTKFDFSLITRNSPKEGLDVLEKEKPELIILDVMLPEMSGFEVCEKIRNKSNVPIIMLTARGDIRDRITGLKFGADDYLPKPFDPRELVMRIESILKRVDEGEVFPEGDIIEFGCLYINQDSHEVRIENKKIDLTTKEYTLLLLFVKNTDKVFSRDDIMNELSGIDSELFSRSVDILVSRLRNKIKPLTSIQTVWGRGYKFVKGT